MTTSLVQYHFEDDVQVYDTDCNHEQWISEWLRCPNCAREWSGVAPRGHIGIECPGCMFAEPMYIWSADQIRLSDAD